MGHTNKLANVGATIFYLVWWSQPPCKVLSFLRKEAQGLNK